MMNLLLWILTFLTSAMVTTLVIVWSLIFFFPDFFRWKNYKKPGKVRTSLVLGSGGHTTEMLRLVKSLDRTIYTPRTYYIASSDKFSEEKLVAFEEAANEKEEAERKEREVMKDWRIVYVPRAREVGQSYLSSLATTISSTLACLPLVWADQTQLLLVNGPGTCLPLALLTFLLPARPKLVFVESVCRVETMSLSASILQYIVDCVLVQWPELIDKYPRTKYIGRVL